MRVSDCMSRDVRLARPDQTIKEAAAAMADMDCGVLPVSDQDRLLGMITDRDIAIRAVARGLGPDTRVREVMTSDVKYCFEDDDTDQVAQNMGEIQVRRLPVVTREKRLVGILSLGDIALKEDAECCGEALAGISRHTGVKSQGASAPA